MVLTSRARGLARVLPVSRNGSLCYVYSIEAAYKEVEDGEFVFAEKVCVWFAVDSGPDGVERLFEILADRTIKLSLGVTGDINCSLVREDPYTFNVGSSISTHLASLEQCSVLESLGLYVAHA